MREKSERGRAERERERAINGRREPNFIYYFSPILLVGAGRAMIKEKNENILISRENNFILIVFDFVVVKWNAMKLKFLID